ncbi:beta-C protein [Lychnis ringspot virus]|uniref:Beta-C protein n=1 Tax=Lychnis ringspot virus TaxID=44421 RepID=Q83079_9VIRU|nr:beta-C protein [Lychnis ringspot virus]ATO98267.1 triple gene block 3 protein [Lychnis ringspot virus]CAA86472.1 beta-C protein [Lychnis ringspot virus]
MPHPLTCGCSDCVLPPLQREFTESIYANENMMSAPPAPQTAKSVVGGDDLFLMMYSFLAGVLLTLLVIWSVGGTTCSNPQKASYYYQDLNKIEMEVAPGSPIDPEVIKAIHHFQNFPYGRTPGLGWIDDVTTLVTVWFTRLIYLGIIFFFIWVFKNI